MKSLKLEHELAELVRSGQKTSTWRLFDDKDLSVNDEVRLIDKVDPTRPETWRVIGIANINRVVEKRLGDVTSEEMLEHNYASADEMLAAFRGYYGDDITAATSIKTLHFTFSPLQMHDEASADSPRIDSPHIKKVKVFADGGSRGNPGPSASGFVIIDADTDKVIVDKAIYLGVTTNNQAEYLALKFALEEARSMGAREVHVFLDSLLVVNQMNGSYKVSNRDLWPLHDAIKELVTGFARVTYAHVPRAQNSLADAAVNRALDEHLKEN